MRYHHAKASVSTITGSTTTSMIAVALSRISRSADETGPCGSSTPAARQGPAMQAVTSAAQIPDRQERALSRHLASSEWATFFSGSQESAMAFRNVQIARHTCSSYASRPCHVWMGPFALLLHNPPALRYCHRLSSVRRIQLPENGF